MIRADSAGPQRRRQDLVDLVLAFAFAGLAISQTLTGDYGDAWGAVVLACNLAVTLPLAARRRYPLLTFLVILTAVDLQSVLLSRTEGAGVFLGLLVGAYSVGAHATRARAVVGLAALPPAMLCAAWATSGNPFEDLLFILTLVGAMWLAGRVVWSRTQLVRQLASQAEELRRSRESEARALVAVERAGIARDVHDVVGHSVSLMVVQAEAGEAQLDPLHPSAECLRAIQRVGRSALADLRTLLAALSPDPTDGPGPASLSPGPGLASIDQLVAELGDAGLRVDLRLAGDPGRLPRGLDLAAYRILQEALTNVLRHAPGATTQVRVDVGEREVAIDVVDSGGARRPSTHRVGAGRGVLGMRERAALYGGQVRTGPTATGGGYEVSARLPVRSVEGVSP